MVHVNMVETGKNIKGLLKLRGMNVSTIATKLGITNVAVYRWLSGMALPTVDNLILLSYYLGVSIDYILICDGKGDN